MMTEEWKDLKAIENVLRQVDVHVVQSMESARKAHELLESNIKELMEKENKQS